MVITDVLGAGNQPVMEPSGNIRYHEIQFLKRKKHRTEMTYHTGIQSTGKINLETIIQVKIDGKQLKIYQNNKLESTIQPFGKTNYLWASVSPNQEMLLFTVAGKGTYVTDLSGNIIQEIGYLNAPQWLKSHWVVGMNDKDNGEQVISSVIEAVHLKSLKRVTLTSATNVIAMYPKIAPTFDRLTFHTPEGEIYIMDIAVEE